MRLTAKDVVSVRKLIRSPEFLKIVEGSKRSNTTLGILQDAFHENVLSRLLRFFCNTSESHELGDRFVREWLKSILDCPIKLPKESCAITAYFGWPAKSAQNSYRYIDLVLIISARKDSRPIAVIGVETKINAPESENQIADYQGALARRFSHVKKRAMIYLTPEGKLHQTGTTNVHCPCYDVSYLSIKNACDILMPRASRPMKTLLRDFSVFLSTDAMKNVRRAEIERILQKLEEGPDTARALEILRGSSQHFTIRSFVYERLLPAIQETFNDVTIAWHYPGSHPRPNEFNFLHPDIKKALPKKAPFEIYYMLKSPEPEPTSGDSVSILLMAYRLDGRKFTSVQYEFFDLLKNRLPPQEGTPQQWGPWTCLWMSAGHQLDNFNKNEARELSELYCHTVCTTKPILLRSLRAFRAKTAL